MADDEFIAKKLLHQRCIYPGCSDMSARRGFCSRHYQTFKAREDALNRFNQHRMAGKKDEIAALYVIGSLEMEPVKVGRSYNPVQRVQAMQCGCPYRLYVFGALYGRRDAIIALEWETHRALTEFGFHVSGEWFDAPPQDTLAVARKCADMYDLKVKEPREFRKDLESYFARWSDEIRQAEQTLDLVEGHILLSHGQKRALDAV